MKAIESLRIGSTVKFTPLAAAHWREYRDGTLIETGEDVVVEFEDGTKRIVPAADVVVVAAQYYPGQVVIAKEEDVPAQSRRIGYMEVVGDDDKLNN